MTRRVQLNNEASDDFISIRRWLTQAGSGQVARRRLRAITTAIDELAVYPCRNRRGDVPGTRQRVVAGHIVVYLVYQDTGDDRTAGDVLVTAIYGPGRDRP